MTRRVAIIGYSFRFPGTNSQSYWQDLLDGRDLVSQVETGRWDLAGFQHPNKSHPGTSYTYAAGSIGDVAGFDASFFGISPREAAQMDPQQRVLLELSWEALENAGVKPSSIRGSQCGVFIGIASADYSYRLANDLAVVDSSTATGNTASIAANRISYVLDLNGPSMAIDTACSSSMVAFHQACQSIRSGESQQALVGGISLHLHPYGFIIFSKASMLSKRGRCNVFDASGDGYVRSEGGGIFFLKDYDQAVADGNPIIAVVANSAINTDGRKAGLTVPNHQAQSALLRQVYSQAGIDPADIDYLEAHGTGTAVGDPIEAMAIGNALGKNRAPQQPLPIGSVKSNLGHLETASGVAGLVKALHCIKHRCVPATIGIKTLNPNIPFADLNLQVVTKAQALKKSGKLIVGINSFGFGGANAHVILESHDKTQLSIANMVKADLPIVISAKDAPALKTAALDFARFLANKPDTALYDIAYNANLTREWHSHRAVVYGVSCATIATALTAFADSAQAPPAVVSGVALAAPKGAAFIYSGNGAQWLGMGKRLLQDDTVFRAAIAEIDALFSEYADYSIADELSGNHGDRYAYTEIAQPALFAVQVGITRMLQHRGIKPMAVAGHSVGEVAAAYAAGILTLADAVQVIYQRSRLQGQTKGSGAMTAVALGAEAMTTLLSELGLTATLTLAGINSPRGVTVAGDPATLAVMEAGLVQRGIASKRLALDYAFHSPAMDQIAADIHLSLAKLQPLSGRIPFYSTVTGGLLDGRELAAAYWWHNIRQPVRFEQAIKAMLDADVSVFIEIGPHAVLRSYINDTAHDKAKVASVLTTVMRDDDSAQRVYTAASLALVAGAELDWHSLFPSAAGFMQLPNYPWQRERHWHPSSAEDSGLLARHKQHPLLGYALAQQELTWENQLDTQLNPSLADHVVGGSVLFPGTGFAELAIAAAMLWQAGELAEIEELEIHTPLHLSAEHTQLIRLQISPQDGSFSIKGRTYTEHELWTQYAAGRILTQPSGVLLPAGRVLPPTRAADFNTASHTALTVAAGLDYGAAFQCIDYGWLEQDSAVAVLKIPDSIAAELPATHVHPAVLDCTFQLIIQLLQDELSLYGDVTFVPIKMGRIAFRRSLLPPRYAKATLLRRSPRSLTAEFTVSDADGVAIMVVKEARFRSVRLNKNAADHLRFLAYRSIPKPLPFTPGAEAAISYASVQAAVHALSRRAALKGSYRRYSEEVDPLLDSLCSQFIVQTLPLWTSDGKTISTQTLQSYQAANPECAAFLQYLLKMAEEDQVIVPSAEGWVIQTDAEMSVSAQDIWNSLVADYPDFFQIIHSVGRIGMYLQPLVQGSLSLAGLCPQETTLSTLTRQVLGAGGKQKIGGALRALIAEGLQQLPEGQRLGLMEISQGWPTFAMDAGAVIDFNCCDYAFASTCPATLEEAARLQERFPAMATHLLEPGVTPNRVANCQLVLLTLDFDDLEQAMLALATARHNLAPTGTLLVIGQHPARWIDFVFGGQQRHWLKSESGAWVSNQRAAGFWQRQLSQAGFAEAELFELSPDTLAGPYLLLAQLDSTAQAAVPSQDRMPRSWILLADRVGYSAQLADHLAKKLQAQGDLVVQALAGERTYLEALLQETTASYGQLDGIVHLAGLAAAPSGLAPEAILAQQVARCELAANIIQACENTDTNTTCWLLTTGAATALLPANAQRQTRLATTAAVDAALWGFGRTLMNEASNYSVRLVDIEDPDKLATVVNALEREFAGADEEQEIILTAAGARYVPRLQLEPRPMPTGPAVADTPNVRLGFQFPGQLRHLRWQAHPYQAPADHEIEVDVHASGLNFRDVMYALGLLSDEAIENGFAGPTLGLEFSGCVRSVGSQVKGFAVGDRVVGFGPSSFGNRVITLADAISAIPPGISYEAAATIPSTFFTVFYGLRHLARLQAGEKILIHGAAGGVGIAAIQVAKWLGADIYATAGSDEKRDFLRLLGVEHIYDSRSLAFADQILAQTQQQGVDVVINSLAGEAVNRNFRVLKPFGRFLELGKRDFYENTKIGLRPFRNNISYFGVDADQLMQLHPGLTRSLFAEMMALFTEGLLHPLPYHVFEADDIVDAFRYMQQARQIGKIVITYRNGISAVLPSQPKATPALQIDAGASFLVTGGLGGFGLATARWLVARGARNLVLVSRSGDSPEAASALAEFTQQGVKVLARACDVADADALAAVLAEIASSLPPLKGVVHAATVIQDGLARNIQPGQFAAVLAPKVLGAQYLHEQTRTLALDFFILFSSATSLWGNPGQGNYVAANAYLEALAAQRLAAGLPATCVPWGAIDDVGFLARHEKTKEALQSRMGGNALKSAIALAALETMMLAGRSGLAVMELDWQALARFLPSANSPKFSELARASGDSDAANSNADDFQRSLSELSDADLLATLIEMLKSEVGEILRVAPEKIDPTRSIYDMGLDSLMGVELVVALEARFGTRLPVMALSQSPTIAKLAERLVVQLKGSDGDKQDEPASVLSQAQQLAAQHGSDTTPEQLASIAAELDANNSPKPMRIIH